MKEYPSENDLERIEKWDSGDPMGLIEFLEALWKYGEDGYFRLTRKGAHRWLYLSTAGWSGNEEIITALNKSFFWLAFWVKEERGGHFKFHLNLRTYFRENQKGAS